MAPQYYSSLSKSLHWFIALLVILMLGFSFFLGDIPRSYRATAFMLHKSTGFLILILMLFRLAWRLKTGKPALPEATPRWEVRLSQSVQWAFYVLLILMPLCGWVFSMAKNKVPSFYGLFALPLPGIPRSDAVAAVFVWAHVIIAWLLIALIGLHVCGVLYHQLVRRDNLLQRMLSQKSPVSAA